MVATRTIIFHIGLEKTGTDSFQRFCKDNYRALRGQGVFYPMSRMIFDDRNHQPLVTSYLTDPDLGMGPRRAPADVLRGLRGEIAAAKPGTVLISAEHFSSRFRDAEIARLARDFADYPCRIAVVVREHAARIQSAYAQTVLAGRTLTFDDFCNEIFWPENRYARYRDTIEPWERTFGRENMRVFSLASSTNAIEMLCRNLIPQAVLPQTAKSYWDNKSLGASGTEAMRQVNLALPNHEPYRTDRMGQLKWWVLHTARHRMRRLIAAAAGDRRQGRFRMSQHNRERLTDVANADRQWLAASYNIELDAPRDNGDLPPDDAFAKALAEQIKRTLWVKLLMAMRRPG